MVSLGIIVQRRNIHAFSHTVIITDSCRKSMCEMIVCLSGTWRLIILLWQGLLAFLHVLHVSLEHVCSTVSQQQLAQWVSCAWSLFLNPLIKVIKVCKVHIKREMATKAAVFWHELEELYTYNIYTEASFNHFQLKTSWSYLWLLKETSRRFYSEKKKTAKVPCLNSMFKQGTLYHYFPSITFDDCKINKKNRMGMRMRGMRMNEIFSSDLLYWLNV